MLKLVLKVVHGLSRAER